MNILLTGAVVTFADQLARFEVGRATGLEGAELVFHTSVAEWVAGDPDEVRHYGEVADGVAGYLVTIRSRREVRRG